MQRIGRKMLVDSFAEQDTAVVDLRRAGVLSSTHYFEWGDGVAAGVVEIESAPRPGYTGNWASVATVTFSPADDGAKKTDYVSVPGTYGALRHRISTIVEGGTVSSGVKGSA